MNTVRPIKIGSALVLVLIDQIPLGENPPHDPKDPREEFDLGWFN